MKYLPLEGHGILNKLQKYKIVLYNRYLSVFMLSFTVGLSRRRRLARRRWRHR